MLINLRQHCSAFSCYSSLRILADIFVCCIGLYLLIVLYFSAFVLIFSGFVQVLWTVIIEPDILIMNTGRYPSSVLVRIQSMMRKDVQ